MAEETTEQNLGGTLPTSSLLDQHYTMVVKAILDGRVVPFLGAGVNLCDRSEKGSSRAQARAVLGREFPLATLSMCGGGS